MGVIYPGPVAPSWGLGMLLGVQSLASRGVWRGHVGSGNAVRRKGLEAI